MGADNWADCPRCVHLAKKAKEAERNALPSLYGKVSAEEYMQAATSAGMVPSWEGNTFREDYEQGITTDGVYYVSYSGYCRICKLAHKFKHEETVYSEDSNRG